MEQLSVLYMVSIAAAPPAGLSASFHPTDACYYEHRRPTEAYGGLRRLGPRQVKYSEARRADVHLNANLERRVQAGRQAKKVHHAVLLHASGGHTTHCVYTQLAWILSMRQRLIDA